MINSVPFLKNIFPGKSNELELLSGSNYSFRLEKLFEEAKRFIIIVSPFIKINQRIYTLLKKKKDNNVDIIIIHRENFNEESLATNKFKRCNLHAKFYISDKAAILGSMNLYSYSQENNDELGIYIDKTGMENLYEEILNEAYKLKYDQIKNESPITKKEYANDAKINKFGLQIGKIYSYQDIKDIFRINADKLYGINKDGNGNIILISNSASKYNNLEKDGIIYFQGQNTGHGEQKLIYGNKLLNDAYTNPVGIYFFQDGRYCGEKYICAKPYMANSKWFFPLKSK